jgi:SM-20-related protein
MGRLAEGSIMTEVMTLESRSDVEILDLDRLRSAALNTDPYDYFLVSGLIKPEWQERLISDYPTTKRGGSFPLSIVRCGPDFSRLIRALEGKDFRKIVEQKLSVKLEGRPTMFTVRGFCRRKDGKIHTDTESKIVTVLLYMNPTWAPSGGRLRVLRSGTNIDDMATEVSPVVGTMLIFRRCDHSFHGHLPFEGERKVIQMNWVTEQKFVDREIARHRWSALVKKLHFS